MYFSLKRSPQFREEIQSWVADGVISGEQAAKLFARYELDREAPWYLQSGFWLRGLAILLVSMGFLLIISENWHRFNVPVRMAFGLVPLLAAYGFGLRFFFRDNRDAAELTFFFASILFGVNIFLQAQIFHISAYFPNGILWWTLGALPVAIFFRSKLHHFLVQLLFFFWITQQLPNEQFSFWGIVLYAGMTWLLLKQPNDMLLSAHILNTYLFIFNIAEVTSAYRTPNYFLLILFWTLSIMLILNLAYGKFGEKWLRQLQFYGISAVLFIQFLHTFDEFFKSTIGDFPDAMVIIPALAVAIWRTPIREQMTGIKTIALAIFAIYAIQGFFYPGKDSLGSTGALIANLLLFSFAIWRIYEGINSRVKRDFMLGIFLIIALAFSRYVALFGDYITSAIIFMICGGFVWWINSYWNKRFAAEDASQG